MKYLELQKNLKTNVFTYLDVVKLFPQESPQLIKTQLARFSRKGLISRIKRGLFCFKEGQLDELELAYFLYQPSYISLETALNYYGIIPDIPRSVTSVCLTTTKKITNQFGCFYYAKIKPALFFGYLKVKSLVSENFFNLARKEKALLDFFYLRKIEKTADLRLDLKDFDIVRYRDYSKVFPRWVQKIEL